jgi:anti-sigma regulatory factor (Ser/Thr protein kinase)
MLAAGPDEIGQVAQALGAVHRQALRLAADQALVRLDIAGLFIALSRRGQSLIYRQLQLLDEFERAESDPQLLSQLFALDHLAARMRRNEENLLVLAGGEPGRRVVNPVLLSDVIRAAAAEIEDYERVDASSVFETAVAAQVVRDLIHLLAELLENATRYSPPTSRVRVSARRSVDAVTVTIFDEGIGLTPPQLADLNQRLNRPTTLTAELAGTMGLLVVGRLAARHGIRVELRSSGEGAVALVVLPTAVLAAPGSAMVDPAELMRTPPARASGERFAPQADGRVVGRAGLPVRQPGELLMPGRIAIQPDASPALLAAAGQQSDPEPVQDATGGQSLNGRADVARRFGNRFDPVTPVIIRSAAGRSPGRPDRGRADLLDPEAVRARLAGLASGLAAARRRTEAGPTWSDGQP